MKAFIPLILLLSSFTALSQQKRLVPDFASLQYAGSIGFINGGLGYDVFRNKAIASLHYGYVPKSKGGELNIIAGKLLFNTFSIPLSQRVRFNPLAAGIMISYHFGSEFKSHWPEHRYPKGYYWWRSSLRGHINTQTSLTHELKNKTLKSLTYFIDLNISDLYLVSYFQNHESLDLSDIVKVGYGVKANF